MKLPPLVAANCNVPAPPPVPFPAERVVRGAEVFTILNDIRTALALACAAGRSKMVEIEGCRWRANPHGSLTYCGAAER